MGIQYKWFMKRVSYITRRAAKKAGYKVLEVTRTNWRQFVTEETNARLSAVENLLKNEVKDDRDHPLRKSS